MHAREGLTVVTTASMAFTIDYLEDGVYVWSLTDDGARAERITDYTPTMYLHASADGDPLSAIRPHLQGHPQVADLSSERWRPGWRADPERVLRVDVTDIEAVQPVARQIRAWGDRPDSYRLFNVDFSREFRFCLETERDPTPTRELSSLSLEIPKPSLSEGRLLPLTISDTRLEGSLDGGLTEALDVLEHRLEVEDPDVLVVNHSDVVPAVFEAARQDDRPIQLGRLPGYQQLAGRSTYESYGQVGHSPARYNVPGRVLVDRSNTFFWSQSGLAGSLDLVRRSHKPLQELAWASIGNVLTAIQIRVARERNVLVPWNAWRPERFKSMATLHEADRGGFIFAPEVGVHEDVAELDFASLYPNIIVTRNVSPETVCCACHSHRADVPELGYSICDEQGYLTDVLEPIIQDRQAWKAELATTDDEERTAHLQSKSAALKWILVSCFGYQGFSNAKFGRIECHEAINAYARAILLEAKAILEANGWQVVHGIVDSLWVTPRPGDDQTPLETVRQTVTDAVGIPLEYDSHYDWIAFAPCRDERRGALNRYFGARRDDDGITVKGLECRQRDTPPYVRDAQRALLEVFDDTRDPERVCLEARRYIRRLESGDVDLEKLLIETTPSKSREEYTQYTATVAALERANRVGLEQHPGEPLTYVVVDDSKRSAERVALKHELEDVDRYDVAYYRDALVRATVSVVSPLGYSRRDVDTALEGGGDVPLSVFE